VPRFLSTWSFRLTLLYAGLFTASVVVLFGVIYWSTLSYASRDEADEINVEFQAILDEVAADPGQLSRIVDEHIRQHAGARMAYLLEDSAGRKLTGNIDAVAPREGAMNLRVMLEGVRRDIQARMFRLPAGGFLLIGEDSFPLHEMKELVARAFGVSVLATLLLAITGGVIVGKSVLRRVEAVAQTSRAIVAGDLSQRVPMRGSDDEFDHLAASVNAMLDRIEDLMRSMRQVSTDIAHDLRTPLTRLRQRLELARRQNRSVDEFEETLALATRQIDSILETFGALLRIAQIEAGQSAAAHAVIDLSKLLSDIAEDFAPSAEDRAQKLVADIEPGVSVLADRELLTQMVVNLLENAMRHTPPRTLITLALKAHPSGWAVAVSDNGPGIPAEERELVLRPFYRRETSRTTEGNGLGLSLVAAIAKRHGAALTLGDNHPGLWVMVSFSALPAA
jgi:signal transduction histidine kinase